MIAMLLGPMRLYFALALAAIACGGTAWLIHHERDIGRAEVQQKWDLSISIQRAEALAQSEANAAETARRLKAQKESQDAQAQQLAAARADADRNRAAADSLRTQSADTARRWRDALSNSPTGAECKAAGDAIVLSADVLSRADRRAGDLAGYADTARAAGLQCQASYDALNR